MAGLLGDLGSGLINAGAVLNPQVMQGVQRQQEMQRQQQFVEREFKVRQIVDAVRGGAMDQNQGQALLQQLGVNLPVGPDIQTQQHIQQLAANQEFLSRLQGGQIGAPQQQQAPGLGAPGGITGGQPQGTPSIDPVLVAQSPMAKSYQQALEAQAKLRRDQEALPTGMRLDIAKYTPESLAKYQQTKNLSDLVHIDSAPKVAPETSEVRNITAMLESLGLKKGTPEFNSRFSSEMQKVLTKKEGLTVKVGGVGGEGGTPKPISDDDLKSMSWDDFSKKMKSPLSGRALNDASMTYYLTGQLPQMGMAGRGSAAQARLAAIEGRSKIAAELGVSPEDVASMPASWKANAGALNAVTKDLNTFEPYKKMLDTNADVAIDLGKKVNQRTPVLVNKPLNWLRQNAGDNPDVAEYLAQMRIVQTEAARVINNPRIVGQLTDEARREMDAVITGNAPIDVVERVLNRLKSDGTNRFNAMRSQQSDIMNKMKGGGRRSEETTSPGTQKKTPREMSNDELLKALNG